MAKRSRQSRLNDLVEDLREEARTIFEHAGAFLMREVCQRLYEKLIAAARRIAELEQTEANLRSNILHLSADLSGAEGRIDELEAELQASKQTPGKGEA